MKINYLIKNQTLYLKVFLYICNIKTNYIYKLIHPKTFEVKYIGKTTDIKRRLSSHISEAKRNKGKRYVLNWINSLLKQNLKPLIKIIEVCGDNWQEREKYWIKFYKKNNKLCNICDGGLGGTGVKQFSKKELKKRSNLMRKLVKSKFDDSTKIKIWKDICKNISFDVLKTKYPLLSYNIYYGVKTGRQWNHITNLKKPKPSTKLHSHSYFTKEDILKIRSLKNSMTNKEIAEIYNCHTSIIQRITSGKSYKNIIAPETE